MRVRAVGDGGFGAPELILGREASLAAVRASEVVLWAGGGQEPEQPGGAGRVRCTFILGAVAASPAG